MPIGAIMGAAGGLMNLLGPLFNKKSTPDQINPLTDQRLQDLMAQLTQAQGQFNTLGGEAQASRTAQTRVAGRAGQAAQDAQNMARSSPNAWFEQYLGNVPEYQQVAKQVSEMSMEQYGRDLGEQTNLRMQEAMQAAGDAMAGQGFSGAAASAAGQAAGSVQAEAGLKQSEMAANVFSQTFNQQSQQGQQLAFQDQQMQFSNALDQLRTALGGYQAQGGMLAQSGAQAIGQQGNVGAQLGDINRNIQDITQPVYATPSTTNPLSGAGDALASIGQFAEGGQNQNMLAKLMEAIGGGGGKLNTGSPTGAPAPVFNWNNV